MSDAARIPLADADPEKLLAAICDLIRREADDTALWNDRHQQATAARLRVIADSILPNAPVFRRPNGSLWIPLDEFELTTAAAP